MTALTYGDLANKTYGDLATMDYSLENSGGGGGITPADIAAIAQAVWEYSSRTLTSGGTGGLTAQDVWTYASRSLTGAVSLTSAYDAAKNAASASSVSTLQSSVSALPSASANASAVWGASTRTLTASPTDISGLATASSISALQTSVNAIPTTAAPTKSEIAAEVWGTSSRTITGTVTVESTQAATFVTATGFATPSDVTTAKEAILTRGNSAWVTASGFATPSDIPNDYAKPSDVQVTVTTQTVDLTGIARTSDLAGLAEKTDIPSDYATASALASLQSDVDSIPTATYTVPTTAEITSAVWGASNREITGTVTVNSTQAASFSAVTPATDISSLATSEQVTALQSSVNAIPTTAAPTAAQNASAVWGSNSRTLTASPTDISGLATAASVSDLQDSVNRIPTTTPPTVQDIWEYSDRSLTEVPSTLTAEEVWGFSTRALSTASLIPATPTRSAPATLSTTSEVQEIVENHEPDPAPIAATVWEYPERTLTISDSTTPGAYCTRSDVERRWGTNNVRTWADIDNDRDPVKIASQIEWALQNAASRINSDFASFIYVLPFDPIPSEVRMHAAALAGVELFHCRSMAATNDSPTIQRAENDYEAWKTKILSGVEIPGARKINQ